MVAVLTERRIEGMRSMRELECRKIIAGKGRTALAAVLDSERSGIGYIDAGDIFRTEIGIASVFYVFRIETHESVFPVFDLVPIAILAVDRVHVADELTFPQGFQIFEYR